MRETQSLYQAILEGDRAATSAGTPEPQAERVQPPSLFVGRQSELARLTLAMTESRADRIKISVVTGDSGLGKTRLVTEWLAHQPLDTIVLRGQGHEFEQDISYRPLLDALQQSLYLMPWENLPPASTYTWLAPLAQILPDLYYHLPDLSPTPSQTDNETSYHIMEGLTQLLLSFARQAPLVLFLDDLHWADVATWRFLPFLVRRAQHIPIFIVCTFCTSEASQIQQAHLRRLEQQGLIRLLPLSRLWPTDIARLVSQMLDYPAEKLTPLIQRLHQETQGNPFFAIETVKALAESGFGPPYQPEYLDQLPLPSVIQALIENRLDRLDLESKQALSTAAVIGRVFGFQLLAAVTRIKEDDLLDYLEDWLERGLIVEQSPGRYDFSHQQIREVAYDRLSRPRRRRIHYRVARALETSLPSDIERVAYHDSLSDQPPRISG
jgi:predicted ATPase